MRNIIINADDFGLSEGINAAIERAHTEGILTSASLLANGPAFEHAVAVAKRNPGLSVGVHLNILRGRPVLPASRVPSLAGSDGRFNQSLAFFLLRLAAGRLRLPEIENEFRAQIEKCVAGGLEPTHCDTEKHVHCLPQVSRAMVAAARSCGITRVRNVHQRLSPAHRANGKAVLFSLAEEAGMRNRREEVLRELRSPDVVFGVFEGGRMYAERYREIFETMTEGTGEIVCHPGTGDMPDPREMGRFRIAASRERELHALLDPGLRTAASRSGITLISYRHLA